MPRMDGNGPFGTGPVGRGLGPCGGGNAGSMGIQSAGRGFRRGRKAGWNLPSAPRSPAEEKSRIEQRKDWLQRQIDALAEQLRQIQ